MINITIPDGMARGAVKELDMLNACVLDSDKHKPSDLDLLINAVRFALKREDKS